MRFPIAINKICLRVATSLVVEIEVLSRHVAGPILASCVYRKPYLS